MIFDLHSQLNWLISFSLSLSRAHSFSLSPCSVPCMCVSICSRAVAHSHFISFIHFLYHSWHLHFFEYNNLHILIDPFQLTQSFVFFFLCAQDTHTHKEKKKHRAKDVHICFFKSNKMMIFDISISMHGMVQCALNHCLCSFPTLNARCTSNRHFICILSHLKRNFSLYATLPTYIHMLWYYCCYWCCSWMFCIHIYFVHMFLDNIVQHFCLSVRIHKSLEVHCSLALFANMIDIKPALYVIFHMVFLCLF